MQASIINTRPIKQPETGITQLQLLMEHWVSEILTVFMERSLAVSLSQSVSFCVSVSLYIRHVVCTRYTCLQSSCYSACCESGPSYSYI